MVDKSDIDLKINDSIYEGEIKYDKRNGFRIIKYYDDKIY